MQVIKRKNGTTYYREKIYIDGKPMYSPRFKKKGDAGRWKARFEVEKASYLATGIKPKLLREVELVTLHDEAINWLETRVKYQLATRTYEYYGTALKKHILPLFGNLYLDKIQITHAHQLIAALLEKGHNAKGVNLILGVFKRVMTEATRDGKIDKNPFQYLRDLKVAPRPDVYMTSDEVNRVLQVSRGHYFYSLFLIAVNTGMRRGEIAGLCWDKVNFRTSLIEIARLRDRNGLGDRTKTFQSRRFLPMNAVVKSHLMELQSQSTSDLVIIDFKKGEPFDVNHLGRHFKKFLKKAGLSQHYRFHDLRHTFASHFMMNGGNIYDLQKMLGHSSLEMTQRYAHLAPEHLVAASNVVNFGSSMVERKLSLTSPS